MKPTKLHEVTRQPFKPKAERGQFHMGAIATTEVCNLSCVFCHFNGPRALKKTKQLAVELVLKALKDLPPQSTVYFAATGEYFMDENAVEHLKAAIRLDLTPLVLSHGQLYTPELLDELLAIGVRYFRMSCDAIEDKAYAKIRVGGELSRILEVAEYLRARKSAYPDLTVGINCTLLSNSFHRQNEFIDFWRDKVDALHLNAEYFDIFHYRNIHFVPEERVDCEIQTYVLPSGKIAPCCAIMVYAHDNDVSWLPDIRTHTLQGAYDELCDMYENPTSQLGSLCQKCDWWIMCAKKDGMTPYLRSINFYEPESIDLPDACTNDSPLIVSQNVGNSDAGIFPILKKIKSTIISALGL